MQRGMRLEAIEWPPDLLARFPGPRHGVAGVRELLGVEGRPLLAAVLKPIGLSARELALHAEECALAGVDILKDDHSLADQPAAPFRERIFAVAERVRHAAQSRGGRTLYLPNLSGPVDRILERVEDLREAGLAGGFLAPLVMGLDVLRSLAASSGLVLLAHPSFAGSFFGAGHGIAPELLFGDLFRLAGADMVDFPVAGGRFAFSERDVRAVTSRLSAPLGDHPSALPMVAGGLDREKLRRLVPRHGVDTIFLVGGGVYRGGRTRANARELRRIVEFGA
jgi:ribulose-bisphosphate carboxylase large chain